MTGEFRYRDDRVSRWPLARAAVTALRRSSWRLAPEPGVAERNGHGGTSWIKTKMANAVTLTSASHPRISWRFSRPEDDLLPGFVIGRGELSTRIWLVAPRRALRHGCVVILCWMLGMSRVMEISGQLDRSSAAELTFLADCCELRPQFQHPVTGCTFCFSSAGAGPHGWGRAPASRRAARIPMNRGLTPRWCASVRGPVPRA